MIASPAFEVIAPYRGGVGGGLDLFVVNQALRVFDPSCIRLNPLKVNNLHQGFKVLSSIVQSFFESWKPWKSGIGIYKSLMCNGLRIL
jgi:hypothetical protein